MPDKSGYLTVPEIASAMRISRPTIYRLAARGELPVIRVGARYLIPRDAYEEWLKKKKKEGVKQHDKVDDN